MHNKRKLWRFAFFFLAGFALLPAGIPTRTNAQTTDGIFPVVDADTTSVTATAAADDSSETSSALVGGIFFAAGETVSLSHAVDGDVFAAANLISVDASVDGDVFAAANRVTINDDVLGSVRATGATVTINSRVHGNVLVFAKEVVLGPDAVIRGHVNVYGATIQMDGSVEKTFTAEAERVTVNGSLHGASAIDGRSVVLGKTAQLFSALSIVSQTPAYIDSGVSGAQNITQRLAEAEIEDEDKQDDRFSVGWWLASFFMSVVIGGILILLFPSWNTRVVNAMKEHIGKAWLWGAVLLILIPVCAILLLFTIIGIPLGIVGLLAYGLWLLLGCTFAAFFIGHLAIQRMTFRTERLKQGAGFVVGALLLTLVMQLPIAGGLVHLVAVVWGTGGMVMSMKIARTGARE